MTAPRDVLAELQRLARRHRRTPTVAECRAAGLTVDQFRKAGYPTHRAAVVAAGLTPRESGRRDS